MSLQKPSFKKRKLNDDPDKTLLDSFLNDDEDNSKNNKVICNADTEKENENDKQEEKRDDSILNYDCDSWESLDLNPNTLLALQNHGYDSMMRVQKSCIPHLLLGEDMVVCAQTGSGKTLAFLVPMIERMLLFNWTDTYYQEHGVGSLILSPTRELAMQTRSVCLKLCEFHPQLSVGLLIGGNPKHSDTIFILRGMAICVCTPGRLLDHLLHTKTFNCSGVKILIIDEADRLLDEGYEKEINLIFEQLNLKQSTRQTMLFSATQTRKTSDLIRLSFKTKPMFIDLNLRRNKNTLSYETPTKLEQGYVVIDAQQKFLLLFSFLKRIKSQQKKVLVFCSTIAVTKYLVELLNYIDINVHGLYGAMSQSQRSASFKSFSMANGQYSVLIATNIAARGLDFAGIDWIIQFDPSNDIKNYIHRVGRTCRGVEQTGDEKEGTGKALLFLMPQELKYLHLLKKANVNIKQFQLPSSKKIARIQTQLETITSQVYHLHVLAHNAYQAYIREYGLRSSDVFDVLSLNIVHIAKMFGLAAPPKITVEVITKGSSKKSKQKRNKSKKFKKQYKSVTMRLATNHWAKQQAPSFEV